MADQPQADTKVSKEENATRFSTLSKADQIRYLEALCDRISEPPGDVPVLESHIELAEKRLVQYRRDPDRARPASEVLDRSAKKTR